MRMMLPMPSGQPLFKGCCCGCTLKTGTILIALWYQTASLVQVATQAYRLQTGDYMGGNNDQTLQRMFSSDDGLLMPHPFLDSIEVMYTFPLLVTSLVMTIFEAATCAMLLFGTIKERAGFILPWVIVETVVACSSAIVMVQMAAGFLSDDEFFLAGVIGLIACGIFVVLSGYLILVVYSFYKSLRLQLGSKALLIEEAPTETKDGGLNPAFTTPPMLHLGEKNYASMSEA